MKSKVKVLAVLALFLLSQRPVFFLSNTSSYIY